MIALKRIKYFALFKKVKILYSEICKALLKEIKEDLNKWKFIQCSCIRRLVRMALFLKLVYTFTAVLIRIPGNIFVEVNKPILKFVWNSKGP